MPVHLYSCVFRSEGPGEIGPDPMQWTVADVTGYFTTAGFPEQALAFRTQVLCIPTLSSLLSPLGGATHTITVLCNRLTILKLSVKAHPLISLAILEINNKQKIIMTTLDINLREVKTFSYLH